MSDCNILIGLNSSSSSNEIQNNQCNLTSFLYEKYQEFDLEESAVETYLLPQDELTLLHLILKETNLNTLSDDSNEITNPLKLWIKFSRYRIYQNESILNNNQYKLEIVKIIKEHLKASNIVDRVLILERLIKEFHCNKELKQQLFTTNFIVQSDKLDWFEFLVLEILVNYGFPNLQFKFISSTESNFYHFNQCEIDYDICYKQCPILEILLCYLGISVNIKDSFRLLRILNRPYRGLNKNTFTSLRHLASKENLSTAQVAISFVGRLKLEDSNSKLGNFQPLTQWSSGLVHLVDFILKCQDALSGAVNDDLLALGNATCLMSVNDAYDSVIQCLKTICRLIRQSTTNLLKLKIENKSDNINLDELKIVCDALFERLRILSSTSCASKICRDTPGRAALFGGTICGRAAFKLARLLLVSESDRVKCRAPVNTSQPSSVNKNKSTNFSTTEISSPENQNSKVQIRTPTTAGRNLKLFHMFVSPSPNNEVKNNDEKIIGESFHEVVPSSMNEDNSLPDRPMFSCYQSNLEWADSNHSPLTNFSISNKSLQVFQLESDNVTDTQSMPPWSHSTISNDSSDKRNLIPQSEPGTPTKIANNLRIKSRSLFSPTNDDNRLKEDKNTSSTKIRSGKRVLLKPGCNRPTKLKKPLHLIKSNSQRTLLDFYSN